MIITKTPYRISLAGGGSDYPAWYMNREGAVLATSIDKYCYIFGRWLPPFFECKHRIVWSQIELCEDVSEIKHPAVRAIMQHLDIRQGLELHHIGDLPARTGIGSSSSFTVGLLNCLYNLRGITKNKKQLADEAIYIEQALLKEHVGAQDQTTASYGGFNHITFNGGNIKVTPIDAYKAGCLEPYLMLFFTGFSRTASLIAKDYIISTSTQPQIIESLYKLVKEGIDIIEHGDLRDFGRLLDESWQLKRSISNRISTDYIDFLYDKAKKAGAIGGKIAGAGGGGFLLLFVEPDKQEGIKQELKQLIHVPFHFENKGTQVLFKGE